MFNQIGLKPGEVIGKDNWEKIKGLIPADMEKWVRSGKVLMKIGEFEYDASSDDEWDEYGIKHNQGKYTLHSNGNVIEAKSGDYPKHVVVMLCATQYVVCLIRKHMILGAKCRLYRILSREYQISKKHCF